MRTEHYDKSTAELPMTPNLLPLTGFVMWPYSEYVLVPETDMVAGVIQVPGADHSSKVSGTTPFSEETRVGTASVNQDW